MEPYHPIDEHKQPDDQQHQQGYYDDQQGGQYHDQQGQGQEYEDGQGGVQGQYYDDQGQQQAYDPAYDHQQAQDGYGNQAHYDDQQQPYDQQHGYTDDQQQHHQGGYDDPNQQHQQQYDDGYGNHNGGYDDGQQHQHNGYDQQHHNGYDQQQQHHDGYDQHPQQTGYDDQQGGQYDQHGNYVDDGYNHSHGHDQQQQQGGQLVPVEGPSLATVYRWMVSSIGEAMAGQAMTMSLRISMPLDAIQEVAAGISLREPGEDAQTELFKNLWIGAHTRHFHGVIVLAWAKLQQSDTCNPECCPKMIVGKTEVRWKQSAEELAAYEDGDPYKVTYLSLPASEYIDRALAENHGVLSEESITPFVGGQSPHGIPDHEFAFSAYFIPTMKEVYKYMLRVYTHLYLFHIDSLPNTFAGFLAPPQDYTTPPLPTAQIPLERFSFHLAYFLHFGLSYHLLTHDQIDSLGNAMKYFIWNLPDMVDQVPQSFRELVAKGEIGAGGATPPVGQGTPKNAAGVAGAGQASSNPFLQSSTAGSTSSTAPGSVILGSDGKPFRTPDGMYMIMGPSGAAMLVANLPADAAAGGSGAGAGASNETPKEREERAAAAKLAEENRKLSLELEKLKLQSAERERERNAVGVDAFISPAMAAGTSSTSSSTAFTPKPGAPSNIDPQLINLKRSELIKKSIAPFIAHNLAIAKVEQDLRESHFPPNYTPSPGYGANGYLLPTGITKQASSATLLPPSSSSDKTGRGSPLIQGMDNSPKILSPSSRERNKSVTDRSSASKTRGGGAGEDDEGGSRTSKSKSAKGKGRRTDESSVSGNSQRSRSSKSDEGSDSDSEGVESRESSKSANSSTKHSRPGAKDAAASASPSTVAEAKDKEKEEPPKKAPIPRRPIPTRQPQQAREPSCGQRLCF